MTCHALGWRRAGAGVGHNVGMELATARGARLVLVPTPDVPRTKGVRAGRGPAGVPLMCRLVVERPKVPADELVAPVARLGEAHRLADWLGAVADGDVAPGTVPGAPAMRFTAPYLALDLAARDAGTATFRVYLAVPAEGGSVADVHDLVPRRVPMTMPLDAVAAAARAWRDEIPPLPPG